MPCAKILFTQVSYRCNNWIFFHHSGIWPLSFNESCSPITLSDMLYSSVLLRVSFFCISLFVSSMQASTQDAKSIVQKADEKIRGKSSHVRMSIQTIRPDWTRTMEIEAWMIWRISTWWYYFLPLLKCISWVLLFDSTWPIIWKQIS